MKKTLIPMMLAAVLAGCMTNSTCTGSGCCKAEKACAAKSCAVAPNTLTECEKAAGWKLLWDGKTFTGWVSEGSLRKDGKGVAPAKGWKIEDGVLTVLPRKAIKDGKWVDLPKEQAALGGGGDLVTEGSYKDFELKVDFRLTKAANSGIKYFYDPKLFKGTCEEYQVLDPAHPDYDKPNPAGIGGTHRASALYDLMATDNAEKQIKPLGEWNTAKIVSKGPHVEHWLNGVKVLSYERGSAEFRALVAKSKYAKEAKPGEFWGEIPAGRIKIQDHNDSTVSFRNIKIREL